MASNASIFKATIQIADMDRHYTYGGRGADQWWEKNLATLAQPSMQLQCTIQEGQIWMADGKNRAHIALTIFKGTLAPFGQ